MKGGGNLEEHPAYYASVDDDLAWAVQWSVSHYTIDVNKSSTLRRGFQHLELNTVMRSEAMEVTHTEGF